MILFWAIMPDKPVAMKVSPKTGPKTAGSERIPLKAILMVLIGSVFYVCVAGFRLNVSIYVISEHELGTSVESGLATSLSTICGIAAGFAFALLLKVFKKWVVFTGYALAAVGLFIVVFVHTSLFGAYFGACLMGFGANMANPYLMGQLINVTPPRLVPVAMSLLAGGVNLGMFLTMDILGFLSRFAGGGLRGVLLIAAIGASVCTVLSIFMFALNRNTQQHKP
jgi:MFS family permease